MRSKVEQLMCHSRFRLIGSAGMVEQQGGVAFYLIHRQFLRFLKRESLRSSTLDEVLCCT
ncbi:MAG: hypothetical protein O2954_13085 [bacterium]|nr:hypothetical protein [bacterium]